MNKILVTGGAGFIGSHTVDLLLDRGHAVRVLDNLSSGTRDNLPDDHPALEFIEGDITDPSRVAEAMTEVSHCVHLAAQVSVVASVDDPLHSATQNIAGYVNVLQQAHLAGVERLVYASSAAVYGNPAQIPLAEDAPLMPLSPYGLEKKVNEDYAALYARAHGLSSMGLRFFNVFGPRQDPASPYAGVIALFVERISAGRALTIHGDGGQTRDFVYVGDVARTIAAALASDAGGACNVGTGRQSSLLELAECLSRLTGNPCALDFGAARDGDIRHSLARVDRMRDVLCVRAETTLEQGLAGLLDSVRSAA